MAKTANAVVEEEVAEPAETATAPAENTEATSAEGATPTEAEPAEPKPPEDEERTELFGKLTKEDFAFLTDEERAGVDGTDDGEDDDEGDADAGEGEAVEGADEPIPEVASPALVPDAGDEQPEAEADAPAVAETGDEAEASADVGTAADDADDIPVPRYQISETAQEILAALDERGEALATDLEEGKITAAQFYKESAAIAQDRSETVAHDRAKFRYINVVVARFLRDHSAYGPENPVLYNALDAEVRRLQGDHDDPFDPQLLRRAHANLEKAMGRTPAPAARAVAQAPKVKPALPPKTEKPRIPPTLARIPSDAIDDMHGGKFARLDHLSTTDPLAYEETLAKMSPTDRDEYLAGG